MKRTVTLIAWAACTGLFTLGAQTSGNPAIKKFKAPSLAKVMKQQSRERLHPANAVEAVRTARAKARMHAKADQSLWRIGHEQEFGYEEGEWIPYGDYYYTYDGKGRVATNMYDDGSAKYKLFNTYNDNDLVTEQIEEDAFDGENFEKAYRKITQFDTRDVDCPILRETYKWAAESNEWGLLDGANNYTRTITRDDRGNVTFVEVATWYNGYYEPIQRHQYAYDYDKSNGPVFYKFDELVSDGYGGTYWEENLSMKNMRWVNSDGQLTLDWTAWIHDPNNRLAEADIYWEDYHMGAMSGTYDDNGGSTLTLDLYPMSLLDGDGYKEVDTKTYTDNNGSYEVLMQIYIDLNYDGICTESELLQIDKIVETFDEHGNNTSYAEYYNDGEGGTDLTLGGGSQVAYTYDPDHGVMVEQVYSEYLPDFDNYGNLLPTGSYEPFLKITGDELVEVTTGLTGTVLPESQAPTAVYDLSGTYRGTNVQQLPQGVYVVKQGAQTRKVVR